MLNRDVRAELAPVVLDGADAVRADGNNLLYFRLREGCQVGFRQLSECQIVAKPPNGIARTALLFQHAERCAQMTHDGCKRANNFSAARIVRAHAPEPEAVFLAPIENWEFLFGYELVALGLREAHGVAVPLQIQEKLGAVVVLPCSGVDRAAAQANDHGQMLNPDRALVFASAAGC